MGIGGYPAIAAFFAQDLDHETFIFRRFDKLTAKNLLNLQSELVSLEASLEDLDTKACSERKDLELQLSVQGYDAMKPSRGSKHWHERRRITTDLSKKLKNYHKALLLSASVARLESPSTRVLDACKGAFQENLVCDLERGGLIGAQDLAALKPPADKDVLSKTIRAHWPFTSQPSRDSSDIRHFAEGSLVRVVSIISICITLSLIIGPILALNFTTNANARLGIAIAFIALFATGLSLSTGVSRDNIFIATATYSAVLVVYVSGNLGSESSGVFEGQANATTNA